MTPDKNLDRFDVDVSEEVRDKLRRLYSETVVDHCLHPRNFGKLMNPDGHSLSQGSCGDTVIMTVGLKGGRVEDCAFATDGCAATVACCSMATSLAAGRTVPEALARVSGREIIDALGGLPEADEHCARQAAETLRRALTDALDTQKSAWKKTYRKI